MDKIDKAKQFLKSDYLFDRYENKKETFEGLV